MSYYDEALASKPSTEVAAILSAQRSEVMTKVDQMKSRQGNVKSTGLGPRH